MDLRERIKMYKNIKIKDCKNLTFIEDTFNKLDSFIHTGEFFLCSPLKDINYNECIKEIKESYIKNSIEDISTDDKIQMIKLELLDPGDIDFVNDLILKIQRGEEDYE